MEGPLFGPDWRARHPRLAQAYVHYNHPNADHWWRSPAWPTLADWVAAAGANPCYYDYGDGGNVYYRDQYVYEDGDLVATAREYAQQAARLAELGSQALADYNPQHDPHDREWLPLGVFALIIEADAEPTMYFQLAVNKRGIIAGAYCNLATDQALPLHGSVDRRTQRAAWSVAGFKNTVLETGIYNLTKDESSVLLHFGGDQARHWLFVRQQPPGEEKKEHGDFFLGPPTATILPGSSPR